MKIQPDTIRKAAHMANLLLLDKLVTKTQSAITTHLAITYQLEPNNLRKFHLKNKLPEIHQKEIITHPFTIHKPLNFWQPNTDQKT
jgi:hypothetical protein